VTDTNALAVFTALSLEQILREGGSQAWVLNAARARDCTWVVCAQNQHNPDHEYSDTTAPHAEGFLVGHISRLTPAGEDTNRWMIGIDRYARIKIPGLWAGWRNPVRYTSLEELGIDLENLAFEDMPERTAVEAKPGPAFAVGLTIAQAKAGLAATYGVRPEAIEILIRG
jgi:hypothetical protein